MSGGVCVYCARATLTGAERPEHVLPAALGATLVTRAVCDECNTRIGREVEQPFMDDDLLKIARAYVGQIDPRHAGANRTRSPLLVGVTTEGDRIRVDDESGATVLGSRIVDLGDGRLQVRVGSMEERDRLLGRVQKRYGPVDIDSEERGKKQPTYEAALTFDLGLWRREAAKIALAAGSLVYPDAWRTSPDAAQLRLWLNAETGRGVIPPLPVGNPPVALGTDAEHLLYFSPAGTGSAVAVTLFGALFFGVAVDGGAYPCPTDAWRLNWKTQHATRTTLDDLALELAEHEAERRDAKRD